MSTLKETQIINGWYTSAPQRPTNGLKKFFQFFFNENIKNIQNATVQNFQKRQFLYQQLQNVALHLVARSRGLRRATRGTGKRQRSTLLLPGGKRRCPPGPPCMVNKGNPKGLPPTGPFAAALEAIPPDDWHRTWAACRTIMLRRTSKRVKEQVDKILSACRCPLGLQGRCPLEIDPF
jgi:hypothetical protein